MTKARAAFLAAFVAVACAASGKSADYGAVVKFSRGRPVEFADFTMTSLGERKVALPQFKPGFTYQDFEVKSPKGVTKVSWTSGTGVIDSASFTVEGRPYELELRGSVLRKGWLNDHEMVVWPRERFLEALRRARAQPPQ